MVQVPVVTDPGPFNFDFIQFRCILLAFAFAFGAFESWLQNFGLVWIHSKFDNFGLGNGDSWKSQYRSYLFVTD